MSNTRRYVPLITLCLAIPVVVGLAILVTGDDDTISTENIEVSESVEAPANPELEFSGNNGNPDLDVDAEKPTATTLDDGTEPKTDPSTNTKPGDEGPTPNPEVGSTPGPNIAAPSGASSNTPADPGANARTVAVSCAPASGDCSAKISAAIRSSSVRPLKITFGGSHSAGTEFVFSSKIKLDSQVSLHGKSNGPGRPVMKLAQGGDIISVAGTKNVSIGNFDVNMNGCKPSARLISSLGAGPVNLHISNMELFNGAAKTNDSVCNLYYSKSAGGDGLYIKNVDTKFLKRKVHLNSKSTGVYKNIYIQNSQMSEYSRAALEFNSKTDKLFIEGNTIQYHSMAACQSRDSNGKNSNPIIFQPARDPARIIVHTNTEIRNNIMSGSQR